MRSIVNGGGKSFAACDRLHPRELLPRASLSLLLSAAAAAAASQTRRSTRACVSVRCPRVCMRASVRPFSQELCRADADAAVHS